MKTQSRTQAANSHILRVHGLAAVGLGLAAFGAKCHLDGTVLGGTWMTVLQLVCLAILAGSAPTRWTHDDSPLRAVLFMAASFAAGCNVGTWVDVAMVQAGACGGRNPSTFSAFTAGGTACDSADVQFLVMCACAVTAVVYILFFLGAWLAKAMPWWLGSFVTVGSFILCLHWIVAAIAPATFGSATGAGFELVQIKFALCVYAAKVMWDTHAIRVRCMNGDFDVVMHALTMVLNILNLMVRILIILAKIFAKSKEE